MVKAVGGNSNSAPINPAPGKVDLKASIAKNFTKSIINSAKSLSGGGGFKLTIAAAGRCSNKA